MVDLADTLRIQGKLSEAEPLLRRALSKQRVVLGAEYRDTLRTQAVLEKVIEASKR